MDIGTVKKLVSLLCATVEPVTKIESRIINIKYKILQILQNFKLKQVNTNNYKINTTSKEIKV